MDWWSRCRRKSTPHSASDAGVRSALDSVVAWWWPRVCFDEAVVGALQHPHAALAPLWSTSHSHTARSKTIDDRGNHITVTAQHGSIGCFVEKVEQLGVGLYMFASEFREALVDTDWNVHRHREWLECFDASLVRARHQHAG